MNVTEIRARELHAKNFINEQIRKISKTVGKGSTINALSGGVDSAVVTLLGHRALGKRLTTYFINSGLMRQDEPQAVVSLFDKLGVRVVLIDAQKEFFHALKGIVDPEKKREAITQTFYKKVFGRLVRKSHALFLLQGTNLTDIEETVAGIKRQHNVFEQLGIDTKKTFGYKIIEPILQLRKDGVRKIAKALGLPQSVYHRIPFPGPALAARVIGEVTPRRIDVVRKATAITEDSLKGTKAFQYLAILHRDRVTGVRAGKRVYGLQIEIRCWESIDARTATPTELSHETLCRLAEKITSEIPEVVSVTYNITTKPPSTIEAI
jgi:GMP synthase (glutamine-hydrolysing)